MRSVVGGGVAWGAIAIVFLACGEGHNFGADQAGSGGEPSGSSGTYSGNSGKPSADAGASAGDAGDTVTTDPCDNDGARQCSERTPQRCAGGFWVSEPVCPDLCRGDGRCVCDDGTARCQGNTPQTCQGGDWVDGEACDGAAPVCTGAGVCAAFSLKQGGIEPIVAPSAEAPDFVLKEQSLSVAPRVCSAELCVTASIK